MSVRAKGGPMPRYDFVCEPCEMVDEFTVKADEVVLCPECGRPMRRLPPTGVAGYVH